MPTAFGMPRASRPETLTTEFIGRNISSTCSSSGSAIWASAKNIKPLVDANCHTEAIEVAHHLSPIRFSPIHYRNLGSKSRFPSDQTILFGRPLELCTIGKLKKIPPVLEYLLDSIHDWYQRYSLAFTVGQRHRNCTAHSLHRKAEAHWSLANEIEQAWTGVEETDRAIITKLAQKHDCIFLIMVCPL